MLEPITVTLFWNIPVNCKFVWKETEYIKINLEQAYEKISGRVLFFEQEDLLFIKIIEK